MAITVSAVSCDDESEELEYKAQPDGIALNDRFENNRAEAIQEFILDASTGGTIIGSQGTEVTFQPNSFSDGGGIVNGNITIQMIEIYDKGAMLLQDKSTLGMRVNGDKEALKSAGEFFIDANQGGTELELVETAVVRSKVNNFADFDGGMKVFRAGDDLNGDENWVEADENEDGINDDPIIKEVDGSTGVGAVYGFDISSFGWTNLDRWYNFTGPKTEIFVDVPAGYNKSNCAVYLSYDGEPTALARMDVFDTNLEMFTEHYGLIPVGQQVHIIIVTEIDDVLHYAIQGTTIVEDHIEVIPSLGPTTQSALEALINGLP